LSRPGRCASGAHPSRGRPHNASIHDPLHGHVATDV
jgi:hypothetical protein